MIWFIILTYVMANGDVYTEMYPATKPEYNNKEVCIEVGQVLVDQKQIEIGTNSGKVYFICHSIDQKELDKVSGKTGL